jgi:hypothetical protein
MLPETNHHSHRLETHVCHVEWLQAICITQVKTRDLSDLIFFYINQPLIFDANY